MSESDLPRCCLVADDDPAIRSLLAMNLEAEGVTVATAEDGDQAHQLARELLPDLIVLDVMMPGRDGYEVLAELKANPRTCGIPVVLLTARGADADVWEGWKAGADYYITKPFNIDELLDFIDLAFGGVTT